MAIPQEVKTQATAKALGVTETGHQGLLARFGDKYGMDPRRVMDILRKSVFVTPPGKDAFSNEEIAAALVLADQYELDPFRNEIYLARSGDRLLRMIGVDGWASIVNRSRNYDGMDQPQYAFDQDGKLLSCTVTLYRKDRSHPTSFTALLKEWVKNSPTWQTMPAHMLFVKAYKGAARFAFNITFDMEDPSEVIIQGEKVAPSMAPPIRTHLPLEIGQAEVLSDFQPAKESAPMEEPGSQG